MKYKRIAALVLSAALLFSACPVAAQADGEGNIDHGGGSGMGGAGESWWNGDDGVRITVVRASDNKPVSWPMDFTNYNESDVVRSFVRKSKLHYRGGMRLQMNVGKYKSIRPDKKIPKIITEVGTSNLAAIKSYFCSKWVIKKIAQTIGIINYLEVFKTAEDEAISFANHLSKLNSLYKYLCPSADETERNEFEE